MLNHLGSPGRPVRVVFVNIDGVIVPDCGNLVPDLTRRAIAGARARGIKVVLTSDRPVAGTLPVGEQLRLGRGDAFIASRGAVTAEFTGSGRRPFVMVDEPRVFDPKSAFVVAMAAYPEVRMAIEEPGKGWWVNHVFEPGLLTGRQMRVRNEKRLWDTPVTRAAVHAEGIVALLPEIAAAGVTTRAVGADMVDIVGAAVSTAGAAEALRMKWGIPHQDTAAIGSQVDDTPLLTQVRHAAVLDDAADEVKDLADVIVPPLDLQGAATFLDSLTLSTRPLLTESLPTRPRAR
ncbi:HAD family hydrolase [Myceligenerans crystallogenes]|uniref:Hydroxymethylpyrimidine pyrophosphatase n=1 Tax=Myceligenerans crystallogenes TaxID=316335 RepID=A0ABN2ND52_9MICO